MRSCDELHDTARLLDLALGVSAEVSRANDEWDLWDTALAEDFAVAEREEVEDGCGVFLAAAGEVLLALLLWDEGPELDIDPLALTHNSYADFLWCKHTLSRLTTGFQKVLPILWKYLIPTFPK